MKLILLLAIAAALVACSHRAPAPRRVAHRPVDRASVSRSYWRLPLATASTVMLHPRRDPAGSRVLRGGKRWVTAYCETGDRTASGRWPHVGDAAVNGVPFGARIVVADIGTLTVTDRHAVGSTDVDVFTADCATARRFGRRLLDVAVAR